MKTVAFAAAVLASALPAAAQGNGHGNAYGHYKGAVSSSQIGSAGLAIPGTGVRNFGSWLDDASVQTPGKGFVTMGFGLYRTPIYQEVDLPTLDSGFAVTKRIQIGMSVPYAYSGVPGDPRASGFGDVYLNSKVQLRAPGPGRTGFSMTPMIEVLSVEPPSGGGRAHWALPASVERQGSHWRAMGTGGYFSRGAAFGAAAFEHAISTRTWATGSLSYAYSIHRDELSAVLGLQRTRADASGGVTYQLRPDVAVFGSIGRTISAHDDNSASMIMSAGVSFGLTR